jgi:hypothetical protein
LIRQPLKPNSLSSLEGVQRREISGKGSIPNSVIEETLRISNLLAEVVGHFFLFTGEATQAMPGWYQISSTLSLMAMG